jgi:DNA-directed RNA polymerase specialized sigma24 family protein
MLLLDKKFLAQTFVLPLPDTKRLAAERSARLAQRDEKPAQNKCGCEACRRAIDDQRPNDARWIEPQYVLYGESRAEMCLSEAAERYGYWQGSLVARHRPACQTTALESPRVKPKYKSVRRDDERVARAKTLEELLDSLERTITVVVRAFIGRSPAWEGDYDDICQAAKLRICRVYAEEPTIGRPAAFWAAVVKNICLSYTKPARMKRPAKSTHLAEVDTAAVSGTPQVIVEEVDTCCADDIDKLIVQRRAEGHTFADIAAETGVSKTRLKGRLDAIEQRYLERNPGEFSTEGKRAQAKLPKGGRASVDYGRPSRSTLETA